jgi:hypothetical protein
VSNRRPDQVCGTVKRPVTRPVGEVPAAGRAGHAAVHHRAAGAQVVDQRPPLRLPSGFSQRHVAEQVMILALRS